MGKIHVVTDSGSDLPQEVREKHGISVVPLSIQFGDDLFVDGVDMTVEEFYKRLTEGSNSPSTCQPSPADFVKCYENIAEPGDSIISIHLSSKLSGTYQSAVLASSMVNDIDVTVIDTKSASIGIGLVAIAVAEAIQNGNSKEEAVKLAEHVVENMGVFFVVDTLEYLKRNGRIGKAQAMVGSLLNIKPILTLEDGVVTPFDKVRGKSKALKRIQDITKDKTNNYPDSAFRVGLTHADALQDAQKLGKELENDFKVHELIISFIGPTIGVHVGPGTIALMFYPI